MSHSIKIDNEKEAKYKSMPDINARSEEVKVRPDWNQVDPNAPDYINNKPFGPVQAFDIEGEFTFFEMETSLDTLMDYGFDMCNKATLPVFHGTTFPSDLDYVYCRIYGLVGDSINAKVFKLPRLSISGGIFSTNDTYGYGNPCYYTYDPSDDNGLPILMVKADDDSTWVLIISSVVKPKVNNEIEVKVGTGYKSSGIDTTGISNSMLGTLDIGYGNAYIKSSTAGSVKKFYLLVDDSGTLTAVEYT